jgi:anti-sigma-K factor RskA
VQRELSDLREQSNQVLALQTASDARSITASARGATATVTATPKANQHVFMSSGLAELRKGRTYQLWLIGKDGPQPAGTFKPSNGRHEAQILTNISDAVKLGITDEPDGGSPAPTTPVLMAIDIPEA